LKKNRRTRKVSSLVKQTLGEIISKELNDPSMGLVSVTDVEVSPDLRTARVYFTVIGGKKNTEKQINTVNHMGKFLRKKLAERVVLKYIPEIQLFYDETPKKAQKVEKILQRIRDEK